MREAAVSGDLKHVPVSSSASLEGQGQVRENLQQRSLRPKKHILRKPDPSKIVYNRFTPSVQQEEIERELKSKVGLGRDSGRSHGSLTLHPNSLP